MNYYQLFEITVSFLKNRYDYDNSGTSTYIGRMKDTKVVRIVALQKRLAEAQAIQSFGPDAHPEIISTDVYANIDYVIIVNNQ